MKTDTIFYRLFQSFPSSFFELIQLPPSTAESYQFSSVEIKQLAFRIDGVFLPATEATEEPIYFVEVQFQPDKKFYSRFFAEIFLYLDKTELKNDWRAVVIYPARNVDTGETTRYRALLRSEQVNRLYLDELDFTTEETLGIETVKLVIADEETAPVRARQLLEKATAEIVDASRQRELIQLIETIVVYKFTNLSRKEIEAMLGLGDIKQSKVYQEAFEEGIQEGEQRGIQRGIQEGEQRGEKRGEKRVKLAAVTRMLALGASVEYIAEVLAMDVEQVREIAQNQPQLDSGEEN